MFALTTALSTPAVRSVLFAAGICAKTGALRAKHSLPDLPYDYHELEPAINTDIMKIHHSKHHQVT